MSKIERHPLWDRRLIREKLPPGERGSEPTDRFLRRNFGRQVELVDGWYEKNRCIGLEWLLFGRSSPLTRVLCDEGFFELDVEFTPGWCAGFGRVRDLNDASAPKQTRARANLWSSFGSLCAYLLFWGVRDIHAGNILRSNATGNLIAVDVEILGVDGSTLARSLVETGILPGTESDSFFGDELPPTKPSDVTLALDGFLRTWQNLLVHRDSIADVVASSGAGDWPIQVFLRPPPVYYVWLQRARHGKPQLAELPSWLVDNLHSLESDPSNGSPSEQAELEQLTRGDVPYFWTTFRDLAQHSSAVRYLAAKDGPATEVGVTDPSRGQFPSDLSSILSATRLAQCEAIGVSELAYCLSMEPLEFRSDAGYSVSVFPKSGDATVFKSPTAEWRGSPREGLGRQGVWRFPLELTRSL
jgi:hypothetical protein